MKYSIDKDDLIKINYDLFKTDLFAIERYVDEIIEEVSL